MNSSRFLLLLLASTSAYAQEVKPTFSPDSSKQSQPAPAAGDAPLLTPWRPRNTPALSVGLKVGGALTAKAGENVRSVPETTLLPGGVVGVYGIIPLHWVGSRSPITFALQPELLGRMQGSRYNRPSDPYNVTFRLYYLCLPVLLTANFHGVFLGAGLQASYLMAVRERYEFVVYSMPFTNTSDRTTGYQRQELAFVGGVGYRSKAGLGIEARFMQGLTNLYTKESTLLWATTTGQYNVGYQVQISYPLISKLLSQHTRQD